jgi:hypothetical protein
MRHTLSDTWTALASDSTSTVRASPADRSATVHQTRRQRNRQQGRQRCNWGRGGRASFRLSERAWPISAQELHRLSWLTQWGAALLSAVLGAAGCTAVALCLCTAGGLVAVRSRGPPTLQMPHDFGQSACMNAAFVLHSPFRSQSCICESRARARQRCDGRRCRWVCGAGTMGIHLAANRTSHLMSSLRAHTFEHTNRLSATDHNPH